MYVGKTYFHRKHWLEKEMENPMIFPFIKNFFLYNSRCKQHKVKEKYFLCRQRMDFDRVSGGVSDGWENFVCFHNFSVVCFLLVEIH